MHKANIMKLSDGMFLRVGQRVAAEYPDIGCDEVIVDALCMKLVLDPRVRRPAVRQPVRRHRGRTGAHGAGGPRESGGCGGPRRWGSAEDAARSRADQPALLQVIADGGTAAELRDAMTKVGVPEAQVEPAVATMASAWYRTFVAHDPAPSLSALTVPVLAVIGERDTQVVPEDNEPALREALAANPDATVRILPGLNHLLQPAVTGAVDEYAAIETTIDPGALALITDWVAARAGVGSSR